MEKDLKRLYEIEEEAINEYLNAIDFDMAQNIREEDLKEWRELKWKLNGECPTCGVGDKKECSCDVYEVDTTDGIGKTGFCVACNGKNAEGCTYC